MYAMKAMYRVSVRCNLCGDHQEIPMQLSEIDAKAISLLGAALAQESDWNKTITVCDTGGRTPVVFNPPPTGSPDDPMPHPGTGC